MEENPGCETSLVWAPLTAVSKQIFEADFTHRGLVMRFMDDLPKLARHFRLTINWPHAIENDIRHAEFVVLKIVVLHPWIRKKVKLNRLLFDKLTKVLVADILLMDVDGRNPAPVDR